MPSAVRRPPSSYALETIDDDSGCWTPEPRPAASRSSSSAGKPPAEPAAMNPSAVTKVPAASSQRSPKRSARKPAGIWNIAIPPV